MNTLEAFAQALREGADGFEIDVRLTADHRLVALHDPVFHAGGRAYLVSELTTHRDKAATTVAVDAKMPGTTRLAVIPVKGDSRLGNSSLSD